VFTRYRFRVDSELDPTTTLTSVELIKVVEDAAVAPTYTVHPDANPVPISLRYPPAVVSAVSSVLL
jgi:hypothetical protein